MKAPVVETRVRGKLMWKVNLRKKLTGDTSYRRRYFKTKSDATKYYNRLLKDITQHGAAFAELNETIRAGLAKFHALLVSKGVTLSEAAKLLEEHQTNTMTVSEAIALFYGDCEDGGLETGTMREYRSQLERFRLKFGATLVGRVTKSDISEWLTDIGVKDRTRKNYITTLRTFFGFCVRQELIAKNPAELIRKPKDKAKTPVILTIDDVRKFVAHICKNELQLIAPIAISLFAGVRSCELVLLLWSDIDLSKRQIHIRKEISKKPKQRERWIRMSDNLFAWLSICKDKQGKVCKFPTLDNFYRRRSAAFKLATGKPWPPNGARHSFGSYTWTTTRDLEDLSVQMGNSPYVADKHYIAGVEESEGEQFHAVLPEELVEKKESPKAGDGTRP